MSDTATAAGPTEASASTTAPPPSPSAIEPHRVMVFTDNEQRILLEALRLAEADATAQGIDLVPRAIRSLHGRVAYGDEYVNPIDELTRVTLRKRRLEEEVRRANRRITDLDDIVVEELVANAMSGAQHEATGSTLRIDRKIWAKVIVDSADDEPTDEEKALAKAAAGDALKRAGLGDYVRSDFNTNSISAHFRQQVKDYLEEQKDLPEDERVPRPVGDFIPDELRGFIELTDKPTISVRAGS